NTSVQYVDLDRTAARVVVKECRIQHHGQRHHVRIVRCRRQYQRVTGGRRTGMLQCTSFLEKTGCRQTLTPHTLVDVLVVDLECCDQLPRAACFERWNSLQRISVTRSSERTIV